MRCLICYDVADDKRRRLIVKRLSRCAHRVQFSVFEGRLDPSAWDKVWRDLLEIIEPRVDGLLLVPVCGRCQGARREAGTSSRAPTERRAVV